MLRILSISLALFLCCCGSSNSGSVSGTITIDGAPLEGAKVCFYPAQGRASIGTTDSQGKYNLAYSRSQNESPIGEYRVTLSTEKAVEVEYPDSDYGRGGTVKADVISEARAEALPPEYVEKGTTQLRATVKSGENTIDFSLQSSDWK